MFSKIIVVVCLILYVNSVAIPWLENEDFLRNPRYYNYDELTNLLKKLETENPNLVKLSSVGKSVKNRELWVLQINSNVSERSLLTPMFKYVANMHGDETLGRQLTIYLARYLINNYGKNERVTKLVDTTDIYLMPSMNPDGYENSEEGMCLSKPKYVGRENENSVDLNRDFPDQFDPVIAGTILAGRQPETVAVMTWILSRPFVLSGNLHGGAVVASYPYDDSSSGKECCEESNAPDNAIFKQLALNFAQTHPIMKKERVCDTDYFVNGITNGAKWYEVRGGMQDFNYVHSNCFEVTFELSCCKFPAANTLSTEWNNNKESLLAFMESVHWGAKGLVTNEKDEPVLDADVVVVGIDHNITTSNRGEYWRLLLPGEYEMYAASVGYEPSERVKVVVQNGTTTIQNFKLKLLSEEQGPYLEAVDLNTTLYDHYGFLISEPTIFKHHHYEDLVEYLHFYNKTYPNITYMHSIGKSVQGRDLWVLVISTTPNEHVPGKPEFKYVANMHGNEVVGRELLLYLIKYLCERYGTDDRVTALLSTSRIHLLPTMNPDGYEISLEGDASSGLGRNNANNMDLNRNFPDQYGVNDDNRILQPETQAVMKWTLTEPFVLSANLHNGALVANYPFDDNPNNIPEGQENLSPDDKVFKHLAHIYANAHRTMHEGKACPMFPKEHFESGITNGAKWYSVPGGMQDWNYLATGCMEITIEIGCYKYPKSDSLPQYWLDNKEALLSYMEEVHKGIHGFVRSTIGHPIANVEISVDGINHVVKTAKNGDYWRILLPGIYNISYSARGYETFSTQIIIPESGSFEYNATLMKDDPLHWASAYDFGVAENQFKPRYHSNNELHQLMADLENRFPNSSEFISGDDLISMTIRSLKITSGIRSSDETKFHIAVIGNLFATQPIGREISIYLARHLLKGLSYSDPTISKILQNTVVHVVPVIDVAFEKIWGDYNREVLGNTKPDKYVCNNISADFKQVGDLILNLNGNRVNNNQGVVMIANAFKHMLLDEQFDFVLNFEGGSNGIIYPFSKERIQIYKKIGDMYLAKQSVHQNCMGKTFNTDAVLTDFLYHEYYTPFLTAKVSCCEYPAVENIPYIWRDILEPIMTVLNTTRTGVEGRVFDGNMSPMHNATVKVIDTDRIYEVTKNLAHFKVILPAGDYVLEVACHGFESRVMPITVTDGELLSIKAVLNKRNAVEGTPSVISEASYSKVSTVSHDNMVVETDNNIKRPFKGYITTGIRGYIKNTLDHPVSGAKLFIESENITSYSDTEGKYGIPLPVGKYTVKVEASGYFPDVKIVEVDDLNNIPKIVIFTLKINRNVFGVPRLAFVIATGFILAGSLGIGIFCFIACKRRNHEYGLLPQNGYFNDYKDYDESKETELFKRPLQEKAIIRPYYDDDDYDDEADEYTDIKEQFPTSSEDEDELVLVQRP